MTRTHQITIPQVTVPVGTFTRTTGALPTDADNVQLILQQGADWAAGDPSVLIWTMRILYAVDGVNFVKLFEDPTSDSIVPAHFGRPAGQLSYGTNIPDVGTSGRKLRFELECVISRTIDSGVLDVL